MVAGDPAAWLPDVLREPLDGAVEVRDLVRLSAGASRSTWAFRAVTADGSRELVLQHGGLPDTELAVGAATQARVMELARAHGVPVPEVVAAGRRGDDDHLVTVRVEGQTLPRRVLGDDRLADARAGLAEACGRALARMHALDPAGVPGLVRRDPFDTLRRVADDLDDVRPAWEFAFRWLAAHRPPPRPPALVHGDARTGNLLVAPDGLRAVLDWELVHVGDPLEDLGWLCVRTWRFGGAGRVGGFGRLDDLLAGYAAAGGTPVDADEVTWWEVLGNLRWAVICVLQARRHLTGSQPSLELAAVGRRASEAEHDLLGLLAGAPA
jgi:aminoglycoside phosphotransferase (APT) family kinase protein